MMVRSRDDGEESTSPMESVTPSDARAHPAPRDDDAAPSSERVHPAPRDTGHTTSGGGSTEVPDAAPMFANTTSGGGARDLVPTPGTVPSGTEAEPYRPVTEPVSPYRAPTPVERPELSLSAIHATMVTSVAGGTHQQAALLHESHDTPLSIEVVQLLAQAMRYGRTEANQALQRQVIALQGLGLPSDAVITQLLDTLNRMLEYDATQEI